MATGVFDVYRTALTDWQDATRAIQLLSNGCPTMPIPLLAGAAVAAATDEVKVGGTVTINGNDYELIGVIADLGGHSRPRPPPPLPGSKRQNVLAPENPGFIVSSPLGEHYILAAQEPPLPSISNRIFTDISTTAAMTVAQQEGNRLGRENLRF